MYGIYILLKHVKWLQKWYIKIWKFKLYQHMIVVVRGIPWGQVVNLDHYHCALMMHGH